MPPRKTPTITTSALAGPRPRVVETSKETPMVAVRPGKAPIMMPASVEAARRSRLSRLNRDIISNCTALPINLRPPYFGMMTFRPKWNTT